MFRGTPISAKQSPAQPPSGGPPPPVVAREAPDRLLTTAEANELIRRKKGFLEKRRSSGIDSPPYIQRGKGCAVLYRYSDVMRWTEGHLRSSSSDHDDDHRGLR